MTGRIGTAPCGHRGEHVVGTYVQCLEGCDRTQPYTSMSDGVPEPVDAEAEGTRPLCKHCGSGDLEPYLPHAFIDVFQCRGCGRVTY